MLSLKSKTQYLSYGNPSLEREGYSWCSYSRPRNKSLRLCEVSLYSPRNRRKPTIIQPGKISVNRQTFPKNRSSFSWGRTIPWVSHILYLIGKGMRSAGSTNAHCSQHNRSTHVCIIHGGVNCLNSVPYRCYTYVQIIAIGSI